MLNELINQIKFNTKNFLKTEDEKNNIPVILLTQVVSNVKTTRAKSVLKEGHLMIYSKKTESHDKYLLLEWIPLEGYYSRNSKRSLNQTDLEPVHDYVPKCPNNFWQIFRVNTFWIRHIKLIWTDWVLDLGYLIIKDFDHLFKKFKLINGGLRQIYTLLLQFKFKKKYTSMEFYQITFYINDYFNDTPEFMLDFFSFDTIVTDQKNVNVSTYEKFFNEHGQMEDIFNFKRVFYQIRQLTFYYGLESCLRKEAWKFLLGFFTYSSTPEERFDLCEISRQEYDCINQNRDLLKNDDPMYIKCQQWSCLIEKDVNRTDRLNPFYSGSNNFNLKTLKNILLNYCYTRPQMGYTQGMSDLLAPIYQVLGDESDSFWCFINFIENIYCVIFPNNENMDHVTLLELIQFLASDIYSLICRHDTDVCLIFTHRWFLLCFQREFSTDGVFKIWEACWSNQFCASGYFKFFIALAVIFCYHESTDSSKSIFLSNTDDVLMFFTANIIYDEDVVLTCAQTFLKCFRKSLTIPCSLQCLVETNIGGGWEETFSPQINCNCKQKKSCQYYQVSISEHMNTMKTPNLSVDIGNVRKTLKSSMADESIFVD